MTTTTVGPRARRGGRKVLEIMASAHEPAQPRKTSSKTAGDFDGLTGERGAEPRELIDQAFKDHVVGGTAIPAAGDLEPEQLLRYAAGRASEDERTALEDFVKRSRWAYDRVVHLVKHNRPDGATLKHVIARRLLAAKNPKPLAIVGQAILDTQGIKSKSLEDALKNLPQDAPSKTRAACLIGLGRHEEARKLLDSSSKDGESALLGRLSKAALEAPADHADEAALLALLDLFPQL